METQQKAKILKYGQVVRIQGNYEGKRKGVVCSKGFTDNAVYFEVYRQFQAINNYRETLFQLLPRGSFEIHDEYMKMHPSEKKGNETLRQRLATEKDQYFIMIQTKMNEDILFGAEIIFKHIESEAYLTCSDKCSDYRTDSFKLELQTQLSSQMIFKIQPYHSYQQEGQLIHFDEPLKIQSEGQRFWLDSVKTKQVFIDETIEFDENSLNIGFDCIQFDQFRPKMRRLSQSAQRYETVISHNGKESWKFKYHEGWESLQEKQRLKPFDLCVFRCTNNNACMSVNMFTSQLILKENKDVNNTYISLDSIWEVQPVITVKQVDETDLGVSLAPKINQAMTTPQLYQSVRTCTKLQGDLSLKKSQLQIKGQGFILRHFLTGKVMTLQDVPQMSRNSRPDEPDQMIGVGIEEFNSSQKEQLIELQPAKKGQQQLQHGQFVKLLYNNYELQQPTMQQSHQSIEQLRYFQAKNRRSFAGMDSFFKKLQESDLDYRTHVVAFSTTPSADAFELHRLEPDSKRDLLFAFSSQEWLIQFVDILKMHPKEVEVRLTSKILNKITLIIKQLIRYVLNIADEEDVETSEGTTIIKKLALPITRRQKTLKDMYIIELLIEIFFFISYKNGLESLFKHWKNEKEKIKTIFKLSYCLISKIIKGNPSIKLHVSQWLDLFLHQAMMIDDCNVQQSLSELLDNNYYAIQRFISRNSIKRLVEIMSSQLPHEKYLKILSSICVCKGKSILNNQVYCLNLFFQQINFGKQQPFQTQEFHFKFKRDHDQVLVLSHIGHEGPKWRSFQQFYRDSLAQDELQSWSYFTAYFNLLSDLCINRNRQSKKFVDENFPLHILCTIIEDEEILRMSIAEPFLKLIHYAYIDCHHYPMIRQIARVHEWQTLTETVDIQRTQSEHSMKPENCDVQRMMNFLTWILNEFKQLSVKDRIYSQNLYTVLQVLKSTIQLGFWKSIVDLQKILKNLIKICSCFQEFSDIQVFEEDNESPSKSVKQQLDKQLFLKNKVQLTKLNLENLIVMQCKMLACDIISLIFDIETNVRVEKLAYVFKCVANETGLPSAQKKRLSEIFSSTPSSEKTDRIALIDSPKSKSTQVHKSRTSIIYQMIERTQQKHDEDDEGISATNLRSMATQFKRGVSEQDKSFYDVQRWIDEIKSLIDQRSLFDSSDGQSIELIFAELSLYENPDMPAFALTILNRIYGQRRELVSNFEKVLLVAEGQTYELSQETRIIAQKLQVMTDKSILTSTYENSGNIPIWQPASSIRDAGLIQDLFYLSESLKRELDKRPAGNVLSYELLCPRNELLPAYHERELNNRLHQSLLKAQDIHLPILQFIENCTHENMEYQQCLKLLHQSYLLLTLLIWNHMDNKMELARYKATMYNHIHLNVGVVDFLRELFTNNKPLLFSEREIPIIISHIIGACDKVANTLYYKAKLLDFLRVLLVFNSKSIRSNQLLVLQKLQDDQFSNIMVDLSKHLISSKIESSPPSLRSFEESISIPSQGSSISDAPIEALYEESAFEQWIENYQDQYEQLGQYRIIIDIGPQLSYLYTYFQIFSQLIEDYNEINIEKCRQMHPFGHLVSVLSRSRSCWPLKRHLRSYVNRLYYRQVDYENVSQQFIEVDIYNLLQDLQEIIDIKTDPAYANLHLTKLCSPVRFQFLISYVYLCLEESLITLNMVFNNEQFLLDLEEILTANYQTHVLQTHLQLFEMATKLSQLQHFYASQKYISHFCRVLMNIFKSIFRTFDISLLLIREGLFNSALEMTSVTEKFTIVQRKMVGDQVIEETMQTIERGSGPSDVIQQGREQLPMDIDEFELKQRLIDNVFTFQKQPTGPASKKRQMATNVLKMFQPKKVQSGGEEDINEILNHRHKRLMSMLSLSSQFQQFLEEEFIDVCQRISKIGAESMRIYRKPFEVTNAKEFIQNIIRMNINNPGFLRDDLRVFFLKMLERIITEKNSNKDHRMPVDQWTSDFWSSSRNEIEQAQNFLNDCGAAELIYQTFREPQLELRLNLTTECLGFSIAFLLGGNTKSQNSVLNRLRNDAQNTVLNNFALIIRKISRVIYNNFQIKVDKENEACLFHVQTIDNFDFYDVSSETMKRYNVIEPDDAKETAFKKQCLDLLCRFFRVLQLMCENNNVEMKRFIRQQTDSDENVKLNSINFIEFTTMQLRLFLKILSKAVIQIPSFILDFLIEIIQLPCVDNQLTLCKTTFFEDASYMSQFFSVKANQLQRLFESSEDLQELQELQNKILIAVLSVLEGNEDKIYKDLENKLESQFLVDFLKSNLEGLGARSAIEMNAILDQQESTFTDEIIRVLNVSVIIKKIQERNPTSKWLKHLHSNLRQEQLYEIMELLHSRIRNIEIVYQGKTMVVFYPSHPLFEFLSAHTTELILFKVNRVSQREKILGLLEQREILFYELEYNYALNQMQIPITQRKIDLLQKISAAISILINIIMILTYQIVVKENQPEMHTDYAETIVIRFFSICQLICQIMLFVFFSINRAPIMLRKHQSANKTQLKQSTAKYKCVAQLIYRNCEIILNGEDDFLLLFLMVGLSAMGVFYRTYIFVIHLVEIFSRLSLLKNVFQAISYNAKQLLVVALLGVLFVFAFSVIAFNSYFDDIYPQVTSEETCDSIITCMITLITSDVIGNSMTQWDPLKFFFDMMYTVFFGLLFTNIISGIMIDTFAELRDQRQKIEDDMKNFCFICGIERATLEKNNISFEEHTNHQHFIWNYIFYIYCLNQKDSTEYTGLEYWLQERIKQDDIQWFPNTINEANEVQTRLLAIQKQLQSLTDLLKPDEKLEDDIQ